MTDAIEIQPTSPLRATIRPPGSKSITNRALICAALAEGESLLTGALESDDTRVMIGGLTQLGIELRHDAAARTIRVTGCNGRLPAASADLMLGNSGTTVRFLTAVCTLGHGTYRLDGVPRMRERPIQDLLDALAQLGVRGQRGGHRLPAGRRPRGRPAGRPRRSGRQYLQPVPQRALAGGPLRKSDVELSGVANWFQSRTSP